MAACHLTLTRFGKFGERGDEARPKREVKCCFAQEKNFTSLVSLFLPPIVLLFCPAKWPLPLSTVVSETTEQRRPASSQKARPRYLASSSTTAAKMAVRKMLLISSALALLSTSIANPLAIRQAASSMLPLRRVEEEAQQAVPLQP
jgi:hypothetical protein